MKSYIGRLGKFGVESLKELSIDMVLNSLSISYHPFFMNYNMNNLDKILTELHGMLKTAEANMIKNKSSNPTVPVLSIRHGGANKKKKFSHGKGKAKVGPSNQGLTRKSDYEIAPNTDPKKVVCFYC